MIEPTLKSVDSNKTGFLDLPPEIRNIIYEMALVRSSSITILHIRNCDPKLYPRNHPKLPTIVPGIKRRNASTSLLRVCKAVHAEATPVFYGGTKFCFWTDYHFTAFVIAIGNSARHIRRVFMCKLKNGSTLTSAFSRLKLCVHLQSISLLYYDLLRVRLSPITCAAKLRTSLRELKRSRELQGKVLLLDDLIEIRRRWKDSQAADAYLADLKTELGKLIE